MDKRYKCLTKNVALKIPEILVTQIGCFAGKPDFKHSKTFETQLWIDFLKSSTYSKSQIINDIKLQLPLHSHKRKINHTINLR